MTTSIPGLTPSEVAIIAAPPELIPTARVVSSLDCAAHLDGLHFTPAGCRLLGQCYAETMLALLPR